jgi:hypothetical protein
VNADEAIKRGFERSRPAQRTADHYPTGAGVEGAAPLPVA